MMTARFLSAPLGGMQASAKAPSRRAGRPPSAVLTRTKIAESALSLIETVGYPGLTMRALARHLSVSTSALYNHVDSRNGVLRLMEDKLKSEVDTSGFGVVPITDATLRWAQSYRKIFGRHAQLLSFIAGTPRLEDAPGAAAMYSAVAAGCVISGIPRNAIKATIVTLEALILGSITMTGEGPEPLGNEETSLDPLAFGLVAITSWVEQHSIKLSLSTFDPKLTADKQSVTGIRPAE